MSECVENGEVGILPKETDTISDQLETKCGQDKDTTKMNGILGHDEDSRGDVKPTTDGQHLNGDSSTVVNHENVAMETGGAPNGGEDASNDSGQNNDSADSDEQFTKSNTESKSDSKTESTSDSNSAHNSNEAANVTTEKISNADDTSSSNSSGGSKSSIKNELISTVKDDDGEEFMITLNEEDDDDKSDNKEMEVDSEAEKNASTDVNPNIPSPNSDSLPVSSAAVNKTTVDSTSISETSTTPAAPKVLPAPAPKSKQDVSAKPVNKPTNITPTMVSLPIVTLPLPPLTQAGTASNPHSLQQPATPATMVQQGQQLGYVAKIGNQNVFVPISTSTLAHSSVVTQLAHSKQAPIKVPVEEIEVKSSLDMIKLMKWEIQNRIPDNYNWSVAFHPKKEELSSVTSFLLDLGHDVVKEAVYKDIIQIQTKKKENNELKENEVESLEKMKTVYDNTKKKVQHLQLPTKNCSGCNFKTESEVVMQYHLTFPHYDPWWDNSHGYMCCTRCSFRTRVILQFDIHMDTMHGVKARFQERLTCFQCELCQFTTTTKNKLEKHRSRCVKHFKLNCNLQPYFHDVNFVMKSAFYKPKKPVVKQPTPQVKAAQLAGPRTAVQTRPTFPNPTTQILLQQQLPKQATVSPVLGQRLPPLQQRPQLPALFRGSMVRTSPPTLQARPQLAQRATRPPNKDMAGFEVCELCGGYVKDRQALRIHFYYAHKVEMPQAIFTRPQPPLSCDVCQARFWTTQGLSKHKSTQRHFASASSSNTAAAGQNAVANNNPGVNQKCFMCMRKVPNLFVHIEQVHGMTMKELVALKKCIMCGITAPDRHKLEVHMAQLHGVLIKASEFGDSPSPAVTAPSSSAASAAVMGPAGAAPPAKRPRPPGIPMHQQSTVTSLEDKGVKPVGRLNLCVFCQIQFADNIQLTMHCIKMHATCTGCGMVVATNKHLQGHNCKQVMRDCAICGTKNISPENFGEHIKKHVKPCKVSLSKLTDKEIVDVKDKIKREYKPQVISLDSDEDSEVEVVDLKPEDKTGEKDRESINPGEKESKDENDSKGDSETKKESETKEESDSKKVKDEPESKTVAEKEIEDDADTNKTADNEDGVTSDSNDLNGNMDSNKTNGIPETAENNQNVNADESKKRKIEHTEEDSKDGVEVKKRKEDENGDESLQPAAHSSDGGDCAQEQKKAVKRDLETDEGDECEESVPAKQVKLETSD